MDFAFTDRCNEYRSTLLTFMDECIYPNEQVFEQQLIDSGDPHHHPVVMEELKTEARKRGLWNLFQPHKEWGPGLTNAEYAPLAEIMGRSTIAS
jgi:acyl-CoA dehydrogenase